LQTLAFDFGNLKIRESLLLYYQRKERQEQEECPILMKDKEYNSNSHSSDEYAKVNIGVVKVLPFKHQVDKSVSAGCPP
jgi:hypothetical protein